MADWPVTQPGVLVDTFNATTTPAAANTKTAWAECVAATTDDINFVVLTTNRMYWANCSYLIDIGVGPAGSEVVVASNLCSGHSQAVSPYRRQTKSVTWALPVHISKGSRIVCRMQSGATANYLEFNILFFSTFFWGLGFAGVESMGANLADSSGTWVDPGATVTTYGAWTQFTAATPRAYVGLMIGQTLESISRATNTWTLQVAIGASGSEVVVIDGWIFACRSDDSDPTPNSSPVFPIQIPQGTRLSVRLKSTIATASRELDIILYGVY